jgi:hypothetical protein
MGTTTVSKKPVSVHRFRGVSASVFENTSKIGNRMVPFFKVSLQKSYKDGDEFKTTSSFAREDLPVAALLLQRAWEFILAAEAGRSKEE